MAVVFASNGLGLSAASLGLGGAQSGNLSQGVFVNSVTGNLVLQQQDEWLIGLGADSRVLRTYNSQGQMTDDNGDNWQLGVHQRVFGLTGTVSTAGSTVRKVFGDGREALFTWDSARSLYVSTDGDGAHDTLSWTNNTWIWHDGEGSLRETYDSNGRLVALIDADGNSVTYHYTNGLLTEIRSLNGSEADESLFLDYAGTNLIGVRRVTAQGIQESTRYVYDNQNRLIQVLVDLTPENAFTEVDANGDGRRESVSGQTYVTNYTYDGNSKRITSVTEGNGVTVSFTYEEIGGTHRVRTITDGNAKVTTFSYTLNPSSTTTKTEVADPLGHLTTYSYDVAGRLIEVLAPSVGGTRASTQYTYDAAGNVIGVTDALGRVTAMEYDARGNLVLTRDAAGNTVRSAYSASNRLISQTAYLTPDPDGSGNGQAGAPLTNRYVYDSEDHLRFTVSAEGRVTEHVYNANGTLQFSRSFTGASYNINSLAEADQLNESELNTFVSGLSDKTRATRQDYTYDARGQLASTTVYTALDTLGAGVVDGSQATTHYVYDARGNLLKTVAPKGVATTGNVTDHTTSYTYDGLGRLLATTDSLGRITQTQYDDIGNRTVVTLTNGLATTSTYNAAGQLVTRIQADGATPLGTTTYRYDAAGRLRSTQDPAGVQAYVLYDEAGRKVADIQADGSIVEYVYNRDDQLVQSRRYASPVSAANLASLVDGSGNPSSVALSSIRPALSSGADRVVWNLYDTAGRLVKTIDEAGFVTQSFYDGAGRITDVIRYANAVSVAGISGTTQPGDAAATPTAHADDRRTRMFHDRDGKLLATLDAAGYLTETQYDSAGRAIHTIGYATQTSSANWSAGTLTQLRPAVDVAKDIHGWLFYDASGHIKATVDGEGYLTEFAYDIHGNRTNQTRYANKVATAPASVTASTTLASLRPAAHAKDQASSWTYTDLNQLATATDSEGTVTRYTYDSIGNLTQTDRAWNTSELRTDQVRYDKQGRVLAELTAEGSAAIAALTNPTQAQVDAVWTAHGVRHAYDQAGRRISTTDQNGGKTLFYYNTDGNLTWVINALGEVKESRYNALNQLESSIRYGSRIASAILTDLSGGLINTAARDAVAALSNISLDSISAYAYDQRGNVSAVTENGVLTASSLYNAFGEKASVSEVIDASGSVQTSFAYDKRGELVMTRRNADSPSAYIEIFNTYDAFGRVIATLDGKANARSVVYDRLGRVVQVIDPFNVSRSSTYDAFGRVLTQTDGLGYTTTYSYDAINRSATVTTPENISVVTTRNRHGESVSVQDGSGSLTTYEYDKNGNLKKTVSAGSSLSITTQSSYDKADRLIETTDANGAITIYTYDVVNRLLTRTVDPSGLALTTSYRYDAKGQMVWQQDANKTWTQTIHDSRGQIIAVVVDPKRGPDWTGGADDNPDGLGIRTEYAYDLRGKKLTVTEAAATASARVTQYSYDRLGRLVSETAAVDTPSALTTQYEYDANGNVTRKTVAGLATTRYYYDDADRLIYTLNAENGLTKNQYDPEGRLVRTIRYADRVSGLSTYSLPELESFAAARAGVQSNAESTTVYDRDGRAEWTIFDGRAIQHVFDGAGRVRQRIEYAQLNFAYQLPGESHYRINVPNQLTASDRVTSYVYDAAGRLLYAIDGQGTVTEYRYDHAGNAVSKREYARKLALDAGANAGFLSISQLQPGVIAGMLFPEAAHDRLTRSVFDRAGRTAYTIDAAGYVTETEYHDSGKVKRTVEYAQPVSVTATPTIEEVRAALQANAVSVAVAQNTQTVGVAPLQPYAYLNSARLDTPTTANQLVAVSNTTSYVTGSAAVQPYPYLGVARTDSVNAQTEQVGMSVVNMSVGQSPQVLNYALHRSGGSLYQGAGLSLPAGYVSFEATPTMVRATVKQNGVTLFTTYTDVAWTETVNHQYGSTTSYHSVGNWSGQVNIATGSMAPGAYTVVLEALDDIAGHIEAAVDQYGDFLWHNKIADGDGTWSYSNQVTLNIGNQVKPTLVSWAASSQPAGTTANFSYRPSGGGTYTGAGVGNSGGQLQANIGAVAAGNYDYVIEYRDVYNRVVKSASGTFTSSFGATTTPTATFNYSTLSSAAVGGSSISGYITPAEAPAIDYIDAVVTDRLTGLVVSTARTYPDARTGYQGEVNLRNNGSELPNGRYSVAISIHRKDGTTVNRPAFQYDVNIQLVTVDHSSNVSNTTVMMPVAPVQPYNYVTSARTDVVTPQSQQAGMTVTNTSVGQSPQVLDYALHRSGGSLYQGAGLSLPAGYVSFEATPTMVRATVKQNGVTLFTTYTDVAWTETVNHQYGTTSYHSVGNWSGQVNIATGSMAPGTYTVVLEALDNIAGYYETAVNQYGDVLWHNKIADGDGTWSYSNQVTLNIGNQVKPTLVSWAASSQPAGTTANFSYRPSGGGTYTGAGVGNSGGQLQANIGAVAAGNYDYVIEYRDAYNRVVKSASGTFTSSFGATTTPTATFNYSTLSSTAVGGSSISGYITPAEAPAIDYIDAVVTDRLTGLVVSTARTYPDARTGYQGEVDLKEDGSVLANGKYSIAISIRRKSGTTESRPAFNYEVGTQYAPRNVVAWSTSLQPAGSTVSFGYRPQGSAYPYEPVTVATNGGNHQVAIDSLANGSYEFEVLYKDAQGGVIKWANGTFAATGNAGAQNLSTNFREPMVRRNVIDWDAGVQPPNTTVEFSYRPQGAGVYVSAAAVTSGGRQRIVLDSLSAGSYEYGVVYKDSYGKVVKSAAGTFMVTAAAGVVVGNVDFEYPTVSSVAVAGSSIAGYIPVSEVPTIEKVEAIVRDSQGNFITSAWTYPAYEPGYSGAVNLKTGSALADGRYSVTVKVYRRSGAVEAHPAFLYEVGPQYTQLPIQPYALLDTVRVVSGVSTTLPLHVQDTSWLHDSRVLKNSLRVNGGALEVQGVGWSLQAGAVDLSGSPTYIRALVYDGSRLVKDIETDITHEAYDQYGGYVGSSRGWNGQINLSTDYLLPGRYRVVVEVRDDISGATWMEHGQYGSTLHATGDGDGTWSRTAVFDNLNIGNVDRPTLVSWAASGVPAGTTAQFSFRETYSGSGAVSDFVRASIGTGGDGQTTANLGVLAEGNYEYQLRFVDATGKVVGTAQGAFGVARGQQSGVNASVFMTSQGAASTVAGSAIKYFSNISDWLDVTAVTARVTNRNTGTTQFVQTSTLYPGYAGEVNLSTNGPLSNGDYEIGIVLTRADGSTETKSSFVYQVGEQSTSTRTSNFSWGAPSLPAGATGRISVTPGYSYEESPLTTHAGINTAGGTHQVALSGLAVGPHVYTIRYFDSAGALIKEARGSFTVTGSGTSTQSVSFSADLDHPGVSRINSFIYDRLGRLTSSTDGEGHVEQFGYDALSNRISFTNKRGATWDYKYDKLGRLIEEKTPEVSIYSIKDGVDSTWGDAAGAGLGVSRQQQNGRITTAFAYNALGNMTSRTEAVGTASQRTTTYEYDLLGHQTRVLSATSGIYNAAADNLLTNGASGNVSRNEFNTQAVTRTIYDALGRAVVNIDAAGNHAYKGYDDQDRVVYEVDALGYLTTYKYDAFGNQTELRRYVKSIQEQASSLGLVFPVGYSRDTPLHELRLISTASGLPSLTPVEMFGGGAADNARVIVTAYDNLGRATDIRQGAGWDVSGVDAGETAARVVTTRSQYNAFGQVVRQSALRSHEGQIWEHTYFYYDARGNKIGQVDPLGYLTTWQYDEAGNLVEQGEYAKPLAAGSWNAQGHAAPQLVSYRTEKDAAGGYDRITRYRYDAANRRIEEVRVGVEYSRLDPEDRYATRTYYGDLKTEYRHDAVGNVVEVIDAQRHRLYTYYDALGRVVATATPAGQAVEQLSVNPDTYNLHALSVQDYDALGNVTRQTRYTNAVSIPVGSQQGHQAYVAQAANAAHDQVSYSIYNAQGNVTRAIDAEQHSSHTSYDILGRAAKEWRTLTGPFGEQANAVRVFQYDAVGQQIATIEPGYLANATAADFVRTEVEYNGFGEITRRGINGGGQEFYQYDMNGRMVRTNADDGVIKHYQYDLQGRKVAEIRGGTGSPAVFAGESDLIVGEYAVTGGMRTEFVYDLAGRVVEQKLPAFERPGVSGSASSSASVSQAGISSIDLEPDYAYGGSIASYNTRFSWSVNLAEWGSGDVIVDVDYYIPESQSYYDYGWHISPARTDRVSQRFSTGQANNSVDINSYYSSGYVSQVTISKIDRDGERQTVLSSNAQGTYGRLFTLPTPTEQGAGVRMFVTPAGGSRQEVTLADFGHTNGGRMLGMLPGGAASYSYELEYYHYDPVRGVRENTPYAIQTGTYNAATGVVTPNGGQGGATTITPVVQQTLDRWGNVIGSTNPGDASAVTTTRYDWANRALVQTAPQVRVTDEAGATRTTNPVTRTLYDAAGRAIASVDANGYKTTYAHNQAGQVIEEHRPDGSKNVDEYNALGQRIASTNGNGHRTVYQYDRLNRVVRASFPAVTQSIWNAGSWSSQTMNVFEEYRYDQLGNLIHKRLSNGTQAYNDYNWFDTRGKLVRSRNALGHETTMVYDARGNKTRETNATHDFMTWTYDLGGHGYFGRSTGHRDLSGANGQTWYDDNLGHMIRQTNGHGGDLRYGYFANGVLRRIEDRAGNPNAVASYTEYEIDASGRHTREIYSEAGVTHQDTRIGYDSLGRMTSVQDNRYYLAYGYDANGNRRYSVSDYTDLNGQRQRVENWYLYDALNRITLSQGGLVKDAGKETGAIRVTNGKGVMLGYDNAGNRALSYSLDSNGQSRSERYTFDTLGRLVDTYVNGERSSHREYDSAGRVVTQLTNMENYRFEWRASTYNLAGQALTQRTYDSVGNLRHQVVYDQYDNAGNLLQYRSVQYEGTYYENTYTYQYVKFDSYKESRVNGSSSHPGLLPGSSSTAYDAYGNIQSFADAHNGSRNRSFITTQNGQILNKTENGKTSYYFFANGNQLGSTAANEAADFDLNYMPVSSQYPASSPGSYVVSSSDTLQSIALSVFGDSTLWYLIADANGLGSNNDLRIGQNLTIPNTITNLRNASDTYKPYSPGQVIGDTTPTLPEAPPPPPPKAGGGCGGIGMIVMIIVAIVVTVFTAGAALAVIAPAASATAGGIMAGGMAALTGTAGLGLGASMAIGAVAAAAGSIVSQGVGLAMGAVDKFSWKAVGQAALGGAISGGIASYAGAAGGLAGKLGVTNGYAQVAVNGAISSATTQLVQGKFSWKSVAVSAIAAPIAQGVGGAVGSAVGSQLGTFAGKMADRFVSGVVSKGVQIAVYGGGKMNFASIAADAFGNVVGEALRDGAIAYNQAEQSRKLAEIDASKTKAQSGGSNTGTIVVAPAAGQDRETFFANPDPVELPETQEELWGYLAGRPISEAPNFDKEGPERYPVKEDGTPLLRMMPEDKVKQYMSPLGKLMAWAGLTDVPSNVPEPSYVVPKGEGFDGVRELVNPITWQLKEGVTDEQFINALDGRTVAYSENGIQNSYLQGIGGAKALSDGSGQIVMTVYNPKSAFVLDGVETFLATWHMDVTPVAAAKIGLEMVMQYNKGKPTTVYGHSEGTSIVNEAVSMLSRPQRETITLFNFGTAAGFAPSGLANYHSFENRYDVVPRVVGTVVGSGGVETSLGYLTGGDRYKVTKVDFDVKNDIFNHSLPYYLRQPEVRQGLGWAPLTQEDRTSLSRGHWVKE